MGQSHWRDGRFPRGYGRETSSEPRPTSQANGADTTWSVSGRAHDVPHVSTRSYLYLWYSHCLRLNLSGRADNYEVIGKNNIWRLGKTRHYHLVGQS